MIPNSRIGLIIPSSNRLTEPQFHRFAPDELGIHVTRLRMTGEWHRPLSQLKQPIEEAARALSDIQPGLIVFHCTASSMEEGLSGEARVVDWIQEASACPATTTGQAVADALRSLGIIKLVMISPYVEKTNQLEVRYMTEAGFRVIHEIGLGLPGGDSYVEVTPEEWLAIAKDNGRADADGYFLSCTNTRMIETIQQVEGELSTPVVTSNQATLWACLQRLGLGRSIPGLGRLFARP